jgi:hypothetical protein
MDDTYVYISAKLYLKPGQTRESVEHIIQEMVYSFEHDNIIEHEIIDVLDIQIPKAKDNSIEYIDPFDISDIGF